MYLSPSDKDYIVRTVIGEAAGQPDDGQAAVAHVILNRLNSGKWGNTARKVIFAPNQFEPWSTRRDELLGYAPTDPAYAKASQIVENVIAGKHKDPTEGATHFLQEEIVRQRRGGSLPDWASGGVKKIGAHNFYKPGDDAWGERQATLIDKYTKGGNKAPASEAASDAGPAPLAEGLSLIDRYTRKPKPVEQVPDSAVPVPQPGALDNVAPFASPPKDFVTRSMDRVSNALNKGDIGGVTSIPQRLITSTVDHFSSGKDLAEQGVRELREGKVMPRLLSKPKDWEAGGLLKTVGGALSAALSPVTAATEQLVEQPVEQITGSKEIGQKAGLISNIMVPSRVAERSVSRLSPTMQARQKLGSSNLTEEQIARLRDNPRLTPADVNPSVRQKAMGAALETEDAKNLAYARAGDRANTAPEAVREAYSAMAGPAPEVLQTLEGYKKTARANAEKGFGEAFKDIKPINLDIVVDKIEGALFPRIGNKRISESTLPHGPLEDEIKRLAAKLYDDAGVVTDPNRLHEIQAELGRNIRNLSQSAAGADRNVAAGLKPIHDELVKAIDVASGGKYQPARKQYKHDMEIQEAFDKGIELLQMRAGKKGLTEDTPEAWKAWVKDASPEEIQAARLGARAEIERRIQGYRHSARRGTDIDDVPYNHEKFEILFGKQEAKRLQTLLKDEREIANTNQLFTGNSKTAEATAGREQMRVRQPSEPLSVEKNILPIAAEGLNYSLGMGAPMGIPLLAAIGARQGANRLMGAVENARNRRFVDMALTGGDEGLSNLNRSIRSADYQNRLMSRPTPPITYVPPDVRERKHVPVKKD